MKTSLQNDLMQSHLNRVEDLRSQVRGGILNPANWRYDSENSRQEENEAYEHAWRWLERP